VSSGKLLQTLKGHTYDVNHVAFSPDGQTLATASDDETARLWQVSSGKLLQTLEGHTSWVNHAAFSPNGQALATASDDQTARLWQVSSGKLLQTLGHTGDVNHAVFSPDGQMLATASNDSTARLWPVFYTHQALIDYANQIVPHCLTPKQREQFFLPEDEDESKALVKEGENLAGEGQIEAALVKFKEAKALAPCLKLDPINKAATALFDTGKELAKQGKIQAAVAEFFQAHEVDSRVLLEEPEKYAQKLAQAAKRDREAAERYEEMYRRRDGSYRGYKEVLLKWFY
jgi:hypothetical protein